MPDKVRQPVPGEYTSAIEALDVLREKRIDLIFLDIEMPQLSGLDLIQALDSAPRVILVTAHRNYAAESYDFDVVDYLVKPVSFPRFLRAINRYHQAARIEGSGSATSQDRDDRYLLVTSERETARVLLSDIQYIESFGDYVMIHMSRRSLLTKQRISDLERRLEKGFLRIHRSFLVPVNRVTSFAADHIKIGDKALPIGRTYRQAILSRLGGGESV